MRLGRLGGTTIALLALAASAAGCGAGSADVPAAPTACLESWNEDGTAERFGLHIYRRHESRRAQVAIFEAVEPNPNIPPKGACGVIFAIPESDREYGIAGLVETDLGWASMRELARTDTAALERIQGDASDAANATLFPDGSLAAN